MNNYQFLLSEREQGRYDEYMRRGLISFNLERWMEVYQFHVDHPDASTWLVANSLSSKGEKLLHKRKMHRKIFAYIKKM